MGQLGGSNGSGSVVMDTLFRWLDADRSNALSKSEVAALLPLLHQGDPLQLRTVNVHI